MGQTFLIDGSNTIHALFGPFHEPQAGIDEAAAHFLLVVSAWIAKREQGEAEVVFDGGYRKISTFKGNRQPRVIFSETESADSLIIERVRALRFCQKRVIVVTRDRELAGAVRIEEAKVVTPEKFWSWISFSQNER